MCYLMKSLLCGKMTLKSIQARFRKLARALGSERALPTTPQHDGSAHAELVGGTYFYVVTERGTEYERRQTKDADELLAWFVRDLTSDIAGNWEVKHRVPSQDSRRLRFKKHIELLRDIDESWARTQESEYNDVLTRHPFDDASGERVDYFVDLQKQGIDDEEAWKRALVKFPTP